MISKTQTSKKKTYIPLLCLSHSFPMFIYHLYFGTSNFTEAYEINQKLIELVQLQGNVHHNNSIYSITPSSMHK